MVDMQRWSWSADYASAIRLRATRCNGPRGGRAACSFKAISAGMLSPLGIIFGLVVVFAAAQV